MHVAIVTKLPPGDDGAPDPGVLSHYPLAEVFKARGDTVHVVLIDQVRCTTHPPALWCDDAMVRADVAFVRAGPAVLLAATLEASGVPVVNSALARWQAEQKWLTHLLLARAQVPHVPTTLCLPGGPDAGLPPPFVSKPPAGSHGNGVELHRDPTPMAPFEKPTLVQPLVTDGAARPWDWRVLVADGCVHGHLRRTAQTGEWRSNVSLGATTDTPPLPPDVAGLAVAATSAVGLDYAGVDVVHGGTGPLVLEVNANPGWRGAWSAWGESLGSLYLAAARARLARLGDTPAGT